MAINEAVKLAQHETQQEDFATLFEEMIRNEKREGTVVQGLVVSIRNDDAFIDVGLKSEGRVPLKEFLGEPVNVGDMVDVYIERAEDRDGNTVLSREKALREEAWFKYEDLHRQDVTVEGMIIGRVKGGFAVDLGGIIAFLPGSQIDIRPIKDISVITNVRQPFKILKMDRVQGNVVVSRRAILEESRAEAREALLANIKEGDILEGSVKNITDYGAFIDLGSIDGLLHITDISWSKTTHPSEVLKLGQTVRVMVIKYNEETKRVSLGLKQLEKNPWEGFADKFQAGQKLKGTVTSVTDYGAFVEIEPNVEGLVYHTEISWGAKNTHPRKLLKVGDKVDVVILEVDIAKHKIGLSIKQTQENPWSKFSQIHPIGSEIEGTITNIADFGMFVALGGQFAESGIEALVPAVELSWEEKPEVELKKYNKGDVIKGVVLNVDPERERITVGVKQLNKDSFSESISKFNKGEVVTCVVTAVKKEGIEVELAEGIRCFVKKADLSKHKTEQRPERFGVGDKVDAKVITFEPQERKIAVSIKALEVEEEKRAIAEYGSKDSGASLGEILGVALGKTSAAEAEPAAKPAKKASKKKAAEDEVAADVEAAE